MSNKNTIKEKVQRKFTSLFLITLCELNPIEPGSTFYFVKKNRRNIFKVIFLFKNVFYRYRMLTIFSWGAFSKLK